MSNQKCLNCGHENKPSDRCCTNCGSVFWDATPEERSSKKSSKNKLLGIGVAAIILVGAALLVLSLFSGKSGKTGVCTVVCQSGTGEILGSTTIEYTHGATDTIVPPSFEGYSTPNAQVVTWAPTKTELITFIYTPAAAPYSIVYSSVNGTVLGTATADYPQGTTNTITPPDFSGYNTPEAQTVTWDSDQGKTITFTYTPIPVFNETKSGAISPNPSQGLSFTADVEYQNRTATSIQLRVIWTTTLTGRKIYNSFSQRFEASVGAANTGVVVLSEYGHWKDGSSTPRSVTAASEWITVPLSTTNATTVDMGIRYYQVNKYGENVTQTEDAAGLDTVWTINIPAY